MSLYWTEWRERGYGLWKYGKTTYVTLWDRMDGAWLWTQACVSVSVGVHAHPPFTTCISKQSGAFTGGHLLTAQDQISGVCFYSGSHRSFIVAFITVLALAHYTGKVQSQPSSSCSPLHNPVYRCTLHCTVTKSIAQNHRVQSAI
jgi:hypothetical protein